MAVGFLGSLAVANVGQAALSNFKVGYYYDYTANVVAQGNTHYTYATAFSVDWQNVSGSQPLPPNHTDPFVSFCLDINVNIANGWWSSGGFSSVPLITDLPADRQEAGLYRAASLYRHYAPGILSASGNGSGFTWNNKQAGAALQLAIWEVLYEKGGLGYSIDQNNAIPNANEFYVSSVNAGVRSLANTMLSSTWNIEDHNLETTFWNAVNADGTPRRSQDLIGPISAVPEPTTLIAGGLLLLPFLASSLRRKSRN